MLLGPAVLQLNTQANGRRACKQKKRYHCQSSTIPELGDMRIAHSVADERSLQEAYGSQASLAAVQSWRENGCQFSSACASAMGAKRALQSDGCAQTMRQSTRHEGSHSHRRPHAAREEEHGDDVGAGGEDAAAGDVCRVRVDRTSVALLNTNHASDIFALKCYLQSTSSYIANIQPRLPPTSDLLRASKTPANSGGSG
jgi:hypothetical protein